MIKSSFLAKLVPDSLLARLLLILIVPTVIAQLIAAYIFYERHWSNVSEKMINYLAGEIIVLKLATENATAKERDDILTLASENMRLNVHYQLGKKIQPLKIKKTEVLEQLYTALRSKIDLPLTVSYIKGSNDIEVNIELSDALLTINIPNKRFSTPTTYIFIMWMTGSAFTLMVVAIIFCRNQVRSITKLALVAEKFGKGIHIEKFKPDGAKEVRQAALAFLQMKDRIERQITQRTEMLAGVSHDLRTPLTRIKLQIAMWPNSQEIEGLKRDINDMEHMIQNYLAFAKGGENEKPVLADPQRVLLDIIHHYQSEQLKISFEVENNTQINLKVSSFQRIIINLLDNASRQASVILVRLAITDSEILVEIHDNGPGIPEDKRSLVFKPFYRIDNARNMSRGEAGLGLAIVRDIINCQGGQIQLLDSPLGGLKVFFTLPL
jgi:two-component system osmolarity sensor histidine kinase EnvZ